MIGIHDFYSFFDHSNSAELNASMRQYHRDFTTPAGAVAFAIGHDGETGHDREKEAISFSHLPLE